MKNGWILKTVQILSQNKDNLDQSTVKCLGQYQPSVFCYDWSCHDCEKLTTFIGKLANSSTKTGQWL